MPALFSCSLSSCGIFGSGLGRGSAGTFGWADGTRVGRPSWRSRSFGFFFTHRLELLARRELVHELLLLLLQPRPHRRHVCVRLGRGERLGGHVRARLRDPPAPRRDGTNPPLCSVVSTVCRTVSCAVAAHGARGAHSGVRAQHGVRGRHRDGVFVSRFASEPIKFRRWVVSRPARAPPPVDADKRSFPRTLSRVSANAPSPRPQPPSTGLVTYPRSEGRFAGVCTVPAGRSAARRDAPVCVRASRGAVSHQTPKTPPTAETCLLTQCPAAVAHSTDQTSNQETIKRSTLAILSGRNLIGRES